MKTALAFLFFPAAVATIIVLGLIFADGNPWGRRETPMLDRLADLDTFPDVYPENHPEDAAWTVYQAALNESAATGTPAAIATTGVRR